MAKKLTVEVDAETSRAKRKVKELAETGADGVSNTVQPAAERAARSLDNAAGGAEQLSQSAREGSANMRAMTKVFGGMAIRMATSYASKNMAEGSPEQTAVSAIGGAASGALMGSPFGPLGALAGGLIGLTDALLSANAAEEARVKSIKAAADANREQLEALWKSEDRTKVFKEQLKSLGRESLDSGDRIARVQEAIAAKRRELQANDGELHALSSSAVASEANNKEFGKKLAERNVIKSELAQLESLLSSKRGGGPSHEITTALDSLARIGGGSSGGDFAREQLNVQREMAGTLKSIDHKTRNGGAEWQ